MKRRRRRRILFFFEVLILLILVGGIFVYAQINKKLDQMQESDVDMSQVGVNEGGGGCKGLSGHIALVGLDNTSDTLDYGNSDTMIIASINNDTNKVKLVSLYRDTYLNEGTDPKGNEDTYTKANAAYAYGGAQQLMTMMNKNLGSEPGRLCDGGFCRGGGGPSICWRTGHRDDGG